MKSAIIATMTATTMAANPVFPDAWNADSASKLILWQGGTHLPDGSACCDKTASQCKVQAQAQVGKAYTDGPNNRTALVAGGQAVFNFYKGNINLKIISHTVEPLLTFATVQPIDHARRLDTSDAEHHAGML